MKKLIVMLASLSFLTLQGTAQENRTDFRDKLLFGVKGGLNYSNVYDSQGEEFQAGAKYGAAAGIFLSIPIGKFLGLQFYPHHKLSRHPTVLFLKAKRIHYYHGRTTIFLPA